MLSFINTSTLYEITIGTLSAINILLQQLIINKAKTKQEIKEAITMIALTIVILLLYIALTIKEGLAPS